MDADRPAKRAKTNNAGAGAGAGNPELTKQAQTFNAVVVAHQAGPGEAIWNDTRQDRLGAVAATIRDKHADVFQALANELAPANLEALRIKLKRQRLPVGMVMGQFTKKIFAAVQRGEVPLAAIGFHIIEDVKKSG